MTPIVPGTEHISLRLDCPDGDWPASIPGYRHDVRQPSPLQGL